MGGCSQILSGLAKDCGPSMGGVRKVFIALFSDIAKVTVDDEMVVGITMKDGAVFHRYWFIKGMASFTSTLTIGDSGSKFVQTDITLSFNRMETVKRAEIAALSNSGVAVLLQDSNGIWWFFGLENPVTMSTASGQTGTAMTDGNNYAITLQDNAKVWPLQVRGDAFGDFLNSDFNGDFLINNFIDNL